METFTFIRIGLKYTYTLKKPLGYIYKLDEKYIINITKN
jgi:hypothetical protein